MNQPQGTRSVLRLFQWNIFLVISTLLVEATAQPVWEWAHELKSLHFGASRAIAVDNQGNVFVAAHFSGTAVLGTNALVSRTIIGDLLLVKLDPQGNPIWFRQAGGGRALGQDTYAGSTYPLGLSLDPNGNPVVTGVFCSSTLFGDNTELIGDSAAFFVAKWTATGELLWARTAKGGGGAASVASGPDGSSYCAGNLSSASGPVFGADGLSSPGNEHVVAAKFDPSGKAVWAWRVPENSAVEASGVALDASGNVFVTGVYYDNMAFGPPALPGQGCGDAFLAKLTPAGTLAWARHLGGPSCGNWPANGGNVAVTSGGEVYVTARGYFFDKVGVGLLAKYDSQGNNLWSKLDFVGLGEHGSITGIQYDYYPHRGGLVVDAKGAPLLAVEVADWNACGVQVAQFDTAGNLLWYERALSTTSAYRSYSDAIALDKAGNILIAGSFVEAVQFGAFKVSDTHWRDAFVAKLTITPLILLPPQSQVTTQGRSATFIVTPAGPGPFAYQWQHEGTNLPTATNATLVLPAVTAADAGAYRVVVSNSYGTATSAAAELTVSTEGVHIDTFAGLTVAGTVGKTYAIQYSTTLRDPVWTTLTNLTLTSPSQLWLDPQPIQDQLPKRFYFVKPVP